MKRLKELWLILTLGPRCPECQQAEKEGRLKKIGMEYDAADNEIDIYKCDHCNKEFY